MWSEVLDADAYEWFEAHGGMTRANGTHYRATVLSQGGSKESGQLYRDFAGRDARVEPLLERRGLK
jgi:peptidyl-dipeptidase Dcp